MALSVYQQGGAGSFIPFPKPVVSNRDPTIHDKTAPSGRSFQFFQGWTNRLKRSNFIYFGNGQWTPISGPTDVIFDTDDGFAIPQGNLINILGVINGITTRGADNTITIDFDITEVPSIATSYSGDSGIAVPVSNSLNILGGNEIVTTALGSTISIDFTGSPTTLSFSADIGSALPSGGVINILGSSSGIDTSASGNTIFIDFDVTEIPIIPTIFTTDSGTAGAVGNSISIIGGNDINTSASTDIITIDYTGAPPTIDFTADIGTATPDEGIINILGSSNGIDTTASGNTIILSFDITEFPTITTSFTTDDGAAVPSANNINLIGGTDIAISGATDNITIDFTGDLSSTVFDADTGSATPAAGVMNILGGNEITTSGTGDTLTIDFSGTPSSLTFDADTGSASPVGGVINISGGSNITTSGSGSTLTAALDDNVVIVTSIFTPQLEMQGGDVADNFGQITLSGGVHTVQNFNVSPTDRIFLQRINTGSSSANSSIGHLGYSVSPGTSFTITSWAQVGIVQVGDRSVVAYFIIRQN